MVKKDNPSIPYSISNFPKVVPDVKFFSTEPIQQEIKAFVGWDGIKIFDENLDILETLKIYAKQYQNYAQSCGRCTPGKYGGKVLYELLNKIQNDSSASESDIDKLKEVCELMTFTSKCEVGKTTPKPILQILESNPEVFYNAIENKNKTKSREVDSKRETTLWSVDYGIKRDITLPADSKDSSHSFRMTDSNTPPPSTLPQGKEELSPRHVENGATNVSQGGFSHRHVEALAETSLQNIDSTKGTNHQANMESKLSQSQKIHEKEQSDSSSAVFGLQGVRGEHSTPPISEKSGGFFGVRGSGEGEQPFFAPKEENLQKGGIKEMNLDSQENKNLDSNNTQKDSSHSFRMTNLGHVERSETSFDSQKDVMLSGSETSIQNLDSKDSSPLAQNDVITSQNDVAFKTQNETKTQKNQNEIKNQSLINSQEQNIFEPLERYKSAIKTTIKNVSYISKITAPCTDECPSRVDIPAYIEGVKDMRYLDSLSSTRSSMPLAQVCGRVCPHPCENACRRALLDEPISIMELKRVGADVEFSLKQNAKLPSYASPNNIKQDSSNYKGIKSVCVIGAGPAGLSSAYYLALRGIEVDVYEALPVLGGEVAVGVPNYRMPIREYNHDINSLKEMGVRFHVNYEVNKDNIKELESRHSAIVIAVGTRASKRLGCKNENVNLSGYLPAIKFMDSVNLAQKFNIGELPNLHGKKIVCVGGGFTSMDVVRCCIRLGASSVTMLYRRDEATIIKNTSKEEYEEACEEGVVFEFLSAVDEILENNGKLSGLKINRYELVKSSENPKGELKLVSGGEMMECDILIPAVSQEMDFELDSDFGVNVTKWKTIEVDNASYSTHRKGVFAAGDCVSGPLTIVNAVGHGRRVASVVANYIKSGRVEISDDERMEDILKQIGVFDSNREVHGFLSGNKREVSNKLSPNFRNKNFDEVNFGLSREDALSEASRCMRCYYISMCVIGEA